MAKAIEAGKAELDGADRERIVLGAGKLIPDEAASQARIAPHTTYSGIAIAPRIVEVLLQQPIRT